MNKSDNPFDKTVKFKKHSKRWIKPIQISKTLGSIEELSSVFVLMRRDNVE